jgi:hypothetical protein
LLIAERKRSHDLQKEFLRVKEEGKKELEALQKRIEDRFEK